MTPELEKLSQEVQLLGADEAISRLDTYIAANPADPDALTLRGIRHFGAGHRASAIGDYLAALRIDPDHRKAGEALNFANSILDYYNKDLYNP